MFRNAETGIDNWLVFDNAKNWCHIRRTTTGAEFEFAHGTASGLLTGKDHQNILEFMNAGEEKKISLNG
jgi:hypothetical protein